MTDPIKAAFAERAVRREGDVEKPLGPKAQRTREAVLAAAAERFAAQGYQRTTMADVAEAAGLSLGTVYQYFRDRADLVAALVQRHVVAMLRRADTRWHPREGQAGFERILANYLGAYQEAAALAGVWEEVVFVDDGLAELRRALGRVFEGALAQQLRAAHRAGAVRPDVDPAIAARALAGMVDRWCWLTYVFDPPPGGPPPADAAARQLASLWAGALGVQKPGLVSTEDV